MARPTRFESVATELIHVRVTPAQRRDLTRVAAENGRDISSVIRDAVDEYVSDYRERRVFRDTKRPRLVHTTSS